ncbi:MAG: helix-turn-helix domain-containing protein [Acidobacteria bacterium]|nr:helix-turn-helix domain-containing protein [Acidobacteriota bacterium]
MSAEQTKIKQVLEKLIDEMVVKGIYWCEAVSQFEKLFILRVLKETNGNLSRAAETMGVHRNTLSKKIRQHGIETKRNPKS